MQIKAAQSGNHSAPAFSSRLAARLLLLIAVFAIVCVPLAGNAAQDGPAEVEAGFITSIKGGAQAMTLLRDLESHDDRNSFNIAEVGVGLNPKCRMIGVMLEDEGVLGSAHIGIGTSVNLGGITKAPCHYDLLMHMPRIEVDGRLVIDGDKVVL